MCGAVTAFAGVPLVASLVGERGPLADIDHAAFAAVRARRSPAGIIAARAISALAEPGVAYPAAVLAGIGASRRKAGDGVASRRWWWRAARWSGVACRG